MDETPALPEFPERFSACSAVLRALEFAIPGGVCCRDLSCPDAMWVSPGFWRQLGFDPARREPLLSHLKEAVNPRDWSRFIDLFDQAPPETPPHASSVIRFQHSNGARLEMQVRTQRLAGENGHPGFALGSFVHCAGVGEISADIAKLDHDIRTPINAIMGMFELIAMTTKEPKQAARAENGIAASEQLIEIFEQYLGGNNPDRS